MDDATGQATRELTPFRTVLGVDPSAKMVEQARASTHPPSSSPFGFAVCSELTWTVRLTETATSTYPICTMYIELTVTLVIVQYSCCHALSSQFIHEHFGMIHLVYDSTKIRDFLWEKL